MPGTTSTALPSFSHDQHQETDAAKRKGCVWLTCVSWHEKFVSSSQHHYYHCYRCPNSVYLLRSAHHLVLSANHSFPCLQPLSMFSWAKFLSGSLNLCNHHVLLNMSIPLQFISWLHFYQIFCSYCCLNLTQDSLSHNSTPHTHLIIPLSAQCNASSFFLFNVSRLCVTYSTIHVS